MASETKTDAESDDTTAETDANAEADADAAAETDAETEAETETESESETESSVDSSATAVVEASTLQDAITVVSALVDECKIHLEPDGFKIRAVDPANVGMIDLKLGDAAFEAYNGDGGLIGVNLNRLSDITSMADKGQLMHFNLNQEIGKMNIEFGGLSYNLALIDPDSIRQEPDIPDLDLASEVVIEEGELDRGIQAADMVSDHIRLAVDPTAETFNITAEGDTDDINLQLDRDDLIDLQAGDADSLFSLDYLKDMVKAIPSNAAVTLDIGDEYPVKLHFDFADGTGNSTYMLAPRIQSD